MIVKPDLQCKSPYFHGLWYFYLNANFNVNLFHKNPHAALKLTASSQLGNSGGGAAQSNYT